MRILCVFDVTLFYDYSAILSALIGDSSFFFFNDTATTEIYTRSLVGSVRCV